jgi:hypothetical protein
MIKGQGWVWDMYIKLYCTNVLKGLVRMSELMCSGQWAFISLDHDTPRTSHLTSKQVRTALMHPTH